MEEKQGRKINLLTFFFILVIIVMGIFIFKLYNEKTEQTKKASELQAHVNSLNGTLSDLQEKIDNTSETINSNNSTHNSTENTTTTNTSNNNAISFTDEQIKITLSNYLELYAHARCDALLHNLEKKGKLNYDSSKDNILNDGTVITSIKFSDYKNAMLNYVSESEFEKHWTSSLHFNKNSNGYLTKAQGGGGLRVYTVNSITKADNLTYSAKTTATLVDLDNSKEDENFTFTITSYNGNCVIDSFK